jgi:hypothetical protein
MTRVPARLLSLATVLSLVLGVSAVGPAVGADTSVHRATNAERYALKLLNCTRTGGWVKADGSCKGRFSGKYSAYRKPLRLHRKISNRVAWPWSRTLVVNNVCGHSIAGAPQLSQRIRFPGYRATSYGENVGCGWGYGNQAKKLVLAAHRAMQAEKSYNGGHWRNMKNGRYKSVGIGVAVRNGTVMVVYDFYGRLY